MDSRTEAMRDFFDYGMTVDIDSLAKQFNKSLYKIESIAIDCAENVSDDYSKQHFFNEYQGDEKEFGKWFESYVRDCIEQAIEQELI